MANYASTSANAQTFLEFSGEAVGVLRSADFPTATSLVITFRSGLSSKFMDWLQLSLRGGTAADGSIVVVGIEGDVLYWNDWRHGRVTKIDMPAMSAGSKDAVDISVTFQIASVVQRPLYDGVKYAGLLAKKSQAIMGFKVAIDGIAGSSYVSSIGSIAIASGRSAPAVAIKVVEFYAATFRSWMQSGGSSRNCSIQFLTGTNIAVYTVTFPTLRIDSIAPLIPTNPSQQVTVNLRCGSVVFGGSGN